MEIYLGMGYMLPETLQEIGIQIKSNFTSHRVCVEMLRDIGRDTALSWYI